MSLLLAWSIHTVNEWHLFYVRWDSHVWICIQLAVLNSTVDRINYTSSWSTNLEACRHNKIRCRCEVSITKFCIWNFLSIPLVSPMLSVKSTDTCRRSPKQPVKGSWQRVFKFAASLLSANPRTFQALCAPERLQSGLFERHCALAAFTGLWQ